MGNTISEAVFEDLEFIYGSNIAGQTLPAVLQRLEDLRQAAAQRQITPHQLCEKDSILITYGDIIRPDDGSPPLQGLYEFLHTHIKDVVNSVHILPFYPYSSDDGFSVIDYRQVDERLGSWDDISRLGSKHRLMFDLVANHVSSMSTWFDEYKQGRRPFDEFFIEADETSDLSGVFRPRALPLLTEVDTANGKRHVWTTFSDDQIDLNYSNPAVLLEVIDILLDYIRHGADLIRLDAIAYIWKEIGTSCIHHPKTHRIIKLMRRLIDASGTDVRIITETNVPHKENISYFGNGHDEAALVYNFPLPPLTLHAFMVGDASYLSGWAKDLEFPSEDTTYFNFLASHDGVGLMPARGILPEEDVTQMAERIIEQGGYVSYKNNSDGSKSPYEMNMNYFDALSIAGSTDHEVRRFIASQSIMLSLRGVPGIYFHSIIGSGNWTEGPKLTGMPRSINREKLSLDAIEEILDDPTSQQHQVLKSFSELLRIRNHHCSFSPHADQQIIGSEESSLFINARVCKDRVKAVLCITNVADKNCPSPDIQALFAEILPGAVIKPLTRSALRDSIEPYEVLWIEGVRA